MFLILLTYFTFKLLRKNIAKYFESMPFLGVQKYLICKKTKLNQCFLIIKFFSIKCLRLVETATIVNGRRGHSSVEHRHHVHITNGVIVDAVQSVVESECSVLDQLILYYNSWVVVVLVGSRRSILVSTEGQVRRRWVALSMGCG